MPPENNKQISKRKARISSLIRTGEKIALPLLLGLAVYGFMKEDLIDKAYAQYWAERPALSQAIDQVEELGSKLTKANVRQFPGNKSDYNQLLKDLSNAPQSIQLIEENKNDMPPAMDPVAVGLALPSAFGIMGIAYHLFITKKRK